MQQPRLRFKGFNDDWQSEKLINLGNTFNGLSGKNKNDFGHGQAKYITYMNVHDNPVAKLSMTGTIEVDNKQHSVKYGDFLFTTSSETPEEVGLNSVWLNHESNVYLNSFCFGYRLEKNINKYYLTYALRSNVMRRKIMKLAQGISRYNISKTRLMELKVKYPSLAEQTKIGEFFNRFDKLIELQSSRLERLKQLKKGYLQKMFTSDGVNVPRLRFKGFKDDWKSEHLSKIANIVMGQSPSSKNYTNNDSDEILVQGNADLKSGHVIPRIYTKQVTKQANKNNIILTVRAPVGEVAINQFDKVVIGRGVASITGNRFIYSYFTHLPLINYWKRLESGSTFNAVNSNDIKGIKVSYPNTSEQTKVGDWFTKLDKLIELQSSKLEHLKRDKKAYLQKMFI